MKRHVRFLVLAIVVGVVATSLVAAGGRGRQEEGGAYLVTAIGALTSDDEPTAPLPRAIPTTSEGGGAAVATQGSRLGAYPSNLDPDASLGALPSPRGGAMMTPEQRADREIRRLIRQLD